MHSAALRHLDDAAFYALRGTLRDGPDLAAAAEARHVRTFAASLEVEDSDFEATRGPPVDDGPEADALYAMRDENGTFGVEVRATNDEPTCEQSEARTEDPLCLCGEEFPLLCTIRDLYIERTPLSESFMGCSGFDPYVQEFVRYKCVCEELLLAWTHFWRVEESVIDWDAFSQSMSDDSYAEGCGMRARLAAFGAAL